MTFVSMNIVGIPKQIAGKEEKRNTAVTLKFGLDTAYNYLSHIVEE
jgi:hypothetical protein